MAESIVEQGTLAVKDVVPGSHFNNHRYTHHGIGQSLLYLPCVVAGKFAATLSAGKSDHQFTVFFASFLNGLLSALTCLVLYTLALSLGIGVRAAGLLALIHGLCTIQWPYAHDAFNVTSAGLALLTCITLAHLGRSRGDLRLITLSGAALGFGILIRLPMVLTVHCIAIYLLPLPQNDMV